LAITRTACNEWPPRSKKSSSTSTSPIPSTSAQIDASPSSVAVRGAEEAASRLGRTASGAGSAVRSIFPFGVSGRASRTTMADGTM
jgi:hypothetical protein